MSKHGNLRWNPRLPLGHIRIVRRGSAPPRAWVKVDHRNGRSVYRLNARVVYEANFGPIPEGAVIHHKDRDTLNDNPSNLEALLPESHMAIHRRELDEARKPRRMVRQDRLSADLSAAFAAPLYAPGTWNL